MPAVDASSVGQRIKQARREAGLTQAELAGRLGITQRSVQLYESGDVVPYRRLERIGAVCGRSSQWLLYGDAVLHDESSQALRERLHDRVRVLERQVEALRENVRILRDLRAATPAAEDRRATRRSPAREAP